MGTLVVFVLTPARADLPREPGPMPSTSVQAPAPAPSTKAAVPPMADPAPNTRRPAVTSGVVVVTSGEAADAELAWPVALAVYGDASLRPSIDDATARVLAGEAPGASAERARVELAELRRRLGPARGDEITTRALLSDIARRTHAERLAVVSRSPAGVAEVQIFEPDEGVLESTAFRSDGERGYRTLLATLRARVHAPVAERPKVRSPKPPGPVDKTAAKPKDEGRRGLFSSPWFWAAIGGALLSAAVVFSITQSNQDSRPNAVVDWR